MEVEVGSFVGVWDGTHLARMKVTKVNRKTFDAVEEPKSHRPGRLWRIHKTHPYVFYGPNGATWRNP